MIDGVNFEFATAARIVFGAGKIAEAGAIARSFGAGALLVTRGSVEPARPLNERLEAAGVTATRFAIAREPTVADVLEGLALARTARCELVIGFGGGSAIDAAKAIAGLLTNPGDPLDYLEVVGRGQPLTHPAAPCIAIPTTAGTGAEVTRNAVLAVPEQRMKVSLRSPHLLPRVALIDPQLTHDLPPALTASTGMDALTQLIEPHVSCRANPLTSALCLDGIRRVAHALPIAFVSGQSAGAREDLALASLFGGLALANAGLGAVHGLAAPIGGMFPAPHGAVCAALVPQVMAANLHALRTRAPAHPALFRYDEVACALTDNSHARAEDGVERVRQLATALQIQPLRAYGITPGDVPAIVAAAVKASSMKANPLPLTAAELTEILERAL